MGSWVADVEIKITSVKIEKNLYLWIGQHSY